MVSLDILFSFIKNLTYHDYKNCGIIIGLALLLSFIYKHGSLKYAEKNESKRMPILSRIPAAILLFYFFAIVLVMYIFVKSNPAGLTNALVAFAVLIGFSLQQNASRFLSGISLIINPAFQLGDTITCKEFSGEVVEIGFSSTRLQTKDKSIITIPNFMLVNEIVVSQNVGNVEITLCTTIYDETKKPIESIHKALQECIANNQYVDHTFKTTIISRQHIAGDNSVIYAYDIYCVLKEVRTTEEFKGSLLAECDRVKLFS